MSGNDNPQSPSVVSLQGNNSEIFLSQPFFILSQEPFKKDFLLIFASHYTINDIFKNTTKH